MKNISMLKVLIIVMTFVSFLFVGMQSGTASITNFERVILNAPLLTKVSDDSSQVGEGAENFLESMAQRALDFLGNESLSKEQKKKEFGKLLKSNFDMKTIARFALGRHWRTATDAEKREYQKLFDNMIVNVYADRFGEYSGQQLDVRSHRYDGSKDTIVNSFVIQPSGPEVQVDWRIRYKKGKYRVVDVIVEGVSMSVTQRSDFNAIIQRGGGNMEALLTELRTK